MLPDAQDAEGMRMHPAVMDAALQLSAAGAAATPDGGTRVPAGLQAFCAWERCSGAHVWGTAAPRHGASAAASESDHAVCGGAGSLLAELRGLEVKALGGSRPAAAKAGPVGGERRTLYELSWQATPRQGHAGLAGSVACAAASAGAARGVRPFGAGLALLQDAGLLPGRSLMLRGGEAAVRDGSGLAAGFAGLRGLLRTAGGELRGLAVSALRKFARRRAGQSAGAPA
jgi:hypothetical protein